MTTVTSHNRTTCTCIMPPMPCSTCSINTLQFWTFNITVLHCWRLIVEYGTWTVIRGPKIMAYYWYCDRHMPFKTIDRLTGVSLQRNKRLVRKYGHTRYCWVLSWMSYVDFKWHFSSSIMMLLVCSDSALPY